MTETAKALYKFFSSFDIPAYNRNSIPDDVKLPYITYDIVEPDWRDVGSVSASVFYPGTGYAELFKKVDEIKNKVGEGLRIPVESGGCVYIVKDTPFAQTQPTADEKVSSVYLLFGIHALCN